MFSFKEITECLVAVLDQSNSNQQHIRNQLANYKTRWGESLATNLVIINSFNEAPEGATIIAPSYLQSSLHHNVHTVTSINQMTHYDLRAAVIKPKVSTLIDIDEIKSFFNSVPEGITVACDFETAPKLTEEQKLLLNEDDTQQSSADGLSHPSLTTITHFSIALSESESTVIVIHNDEIKDLVFNWLVTTSAHQIWHNLLFDGKHIFHNTGKLPKNYDDSALMWSCILNHTDTFKSKVGLKGLAGKVYGSWAVSSDNFTLEQMYDEQLIVYAGIDSQATLFIYNEALHHKDFQLLPNEKIVPIEEVFPAPRPCTPEAIHSRRYFYHSVVHPLIESFIRLMHQGITIDMDKVDKLAIEIDKVIDEVNLTLSNNPIIQEFQATCFKTVKAEKIRELNSKKKTIDFFIKPFDITNVEHRSYLMNSILFTNDLFPLPTTYLPDGSLKWSVKDIQALNSQLTEVQQVLDKSLSPNSPLAISSMRMLAVTKANIFNAKYETKINSIDHTLLPPFNPGSSKQLQELFTSLKIPSFKVSKTTGLPSYDRAVVEHINETTSNPDIKDLTKCIIDYSFSAIIKSNFLKGFKLYTIDGSLKGNIRLFGAKSFRPTSNRINLLQLPSTGSRFAKPVKKCFIARPGFITASSDYSALQEVTAANVTQDKNKVKIIGKGFDSHCFHATAYYPEIEQILGPDDGSLEWNKRFKKETKSNPRLEELRQLSKPISFKLMFGGMPDDHKGGSITPEIYHKFHNDLYPGITEYNNNTVLSQVKNTGELHMGLGCYIRSNDPDRDARTLGNVAIQFYDLITLIVIPQIQAAIDKANLSNDIFITATIYDALYFEVREDSTIIKWLNDNLIAIMTKPMFTDMKVPNKANLDIGPSWAEQIEVPNNASIEQIEEALTKLQDIN